MPSVSRQFVARTDSSSSARLMFSLRSSSRSTASLRRRAADLDRFVERHFRARLGVLDERVEVLAENLGRLDQGHLRADGAVGPDFHHQPVVVRLLADAGFLDVVLHADDRARSCYRPG